MLTVTRLPRRDPAKVRTMKTLLIDVGALAVFLGYMALVYRHAVSHRAQPRERRVSDVSRDA